MTRSPKRSNSRPPRGSRPSARSRDGQTRDGSRPVKPLAGLDDAQRQRQESGAQTRKPAGKTAPKSAQRSSSTAGRASAAGRSSTGRAAPPKVKKPLPELKRVQLQAPAPDAVFKDLDGETLSFPESNLKRVAAQLLTQRRKAWRYRPFSFPLFTDKGHEQAFHFDFYIYDPEGSVIRLILVVPHESREVWDRIGRFKRQYPMYTYELWTPEKLYQWQKPGARLGW